MPAKTMTPTITAPTIIEMKPGSPSFSILTPDRIYVSLIPLKLENETEQYRHHQGVNSDSFRHGNG